MVLLLSHVLFNGRTIIDETHSENYASISYCYFRIHSNDSNNSYFMNLINPHPVVKSRLITTSSIFIQSNVCRAICSFDTFLFTNHKKKLYILSKLTINRDTNPWCIFSSFFRKLEDATVLLCFHLWIIMGIPVITSVKCSK